MGHEKVARLPFCTCPCDILFGVSVCILRRVFEQLANSRAVTISPPPPPPHRGRPRLPTVLISVFTVCYRSGLIFRGPSCT